MKPISILLIEDNPGDVDLTTVSLRDSKLRNSLKAIQDGAEALVYLRRQAEHGNASRPDVILLDLNLPGMSGQEVLAEIKQDPALRSIPVVILTSSETETDIVRGYDLGANCYITKPVNLEQFKTIVRSIEEFWFSVVKLSPI